eukprot:scaffold77958_cov18-Tisochrysis_lutea.AAC.2
MAELSSAEIWTDDFNPVNKWNAAKLICKHAHGVLLEQAYMQPMPGMQMCRLNAFKDQYTHKRQCMCTSALTLAVMCPFAFTQVPDPPGPYVRQEVHSHCGFSLGAPAYHLGVLRARGGSVLASNLCTFRHIECGHRPRCLGTPASHAVWLHASSIMGCDFKPCEQTSHALTYRALT